MVGFFLASQEGVVSRAEVELSVAPRVCVVETDKTACQEIVHVQWRSSQALDACLYLAKQESPLGCWTQSFEGETRLDVDTASELVFELRLKESELPLALTEFRILRQAEGRKRRRSPWRFF